MTMRMTGIVSGMDTESIIKEMVAVKKTKVDDAKKSQTKLQWKQEQWKSLNTKLKNLQSKYFGNMRFSTAYSKRTTNVSNSSYVSVITGEDAVNGVQNLEIDKLAKTGYLTGAKLNGTAGKLTALSKLSDIAGNTVTGECSFEVMSNGQTQTITMSADSTISDVVTQLKKAGLNANFDANNQRLFVSAKESGAAANFSFITNDAAGAAALSSLGINVGLNQDATALAEYQKYAAYYVSGDRAATLNNMRTLISAKAESGVRDYLDSYRSLQANKKQFQENIDAIYDKYSADPLKSISEYQAELDAKNEEIMHLRESMDGMDDDSLATAQTQLETLQEEASKINEKLTDATTLVTDSTKIATTDTELARIETYINVTATTVDGNTSYTAVVGDKLTEDAENQYYQKAKYAANVMTAYDPTDTTITGATKINGQDSLIYLNGAEFTSNTNVFEINGLTFTALAETEAGKPITVTTQNDTNGIYDLIKDYLKEYNAVINEMDKLYNADAAKGYEPLTSEEKESMSDKDIEEWEKKVKDSLLRRDENVSNVSSALKEIMMKGAEVNGKQMYLSDFGINTLSYFISADNEKNAYHIDGNPDDAETAGNADKLKSMIANDPDTVISFFTALNNNLYQKMNKLSTSVEGYRSFGTYYDDKKMTSDYSDYKDKIKELENKLSDYEDKWYKKFSAMETALAKMQSNTSAVTSLLGGQ